MFQDILNRELYFDDSKVEASSEAKDLIKKLLVKKQEERIGFSDIQEIKERLDAIEQHLDLRD